MTLVESSVAGVNTWSLNLVSPVAGTSLSLGSAAGSLTGRLNGLNLPAGIPSFGKKNTQNQTAAGNNSAAAGAGKVFYAANAQIRFTMSQPAGNTAAAGRAGQPATAVQPSAFASGSPAPAAANPATAAAPAMPGNAAPATAAAPSGQAGSSTVVWANVQYVLQGCQRQAPHIVCQVQLTNLAGGDTNLTTRRDSYYIDQAGNKVGINSASAANCNLFGACLALSGLPMAGTFVFLDEDSKSTKLVRLQIQAASGPVQFTNVPVN